MAGKTGLTIAIDASRTTVPHITGTERYSLDIIRALIRHNRRHHLHLYFRDQPADDLFPDHPLVTRHVIPFRRAWTHLRFAGAIWRSRPDVTFVPSHTLPFLFPGKALVTVHDLGYKHFPQAHQAASRWYLNLTTAYSARRAQRVIAISQATADDLTHFYKIAPDKIKVIHHGVHRIEYSGNDVRAKYTLPERYFLFVGTLQPRKNIDNLVRAYRSYRDRVDNPAALVLAGRKGWLYDERWTMGVAGVHVLGYVDEGDKADLYANAVALTFPSLYEGFGLPVIEAMQCGLPVLTSNTSSLPELVGAAAITVDPKDRTAITRGMVQISSDYDLRERLRDAGYERTRQFTWDRAALQLMELLQEFTDEKKPSS